MFKKTEILISEHLREDVSLQWCKGSKSVLSGRFGYPYGRPGDSFCIRETPGLPGRVGMYAMILSVVSIFPLFLLSGATTEYRATHFHIIE